MPNRFNIYQQDNYLVLENIEVQLEEGINYRQARLIADECSKYNALIIIENPRSSKDRTAFSNGKSIAGLVSLCVPKGTKVDITIRKSDESEIIARRLFNGLTTSSLDPDFEYPGS